MDAMPEQSFYLAMVMCVESEEAGSKATMLAASILADKKQPEGNADWMLVEEEKEKWFKGFKP